MVRKQRIEITDSLGRRRSLDQGGMAFVSLELDDDFGGAGDRSDKPDKSGAPVLLLGLGPEPAKALQRFAPGGWVESPDFLRALALGRDIPEAELIPGEARGWRLEPEQAVAFARKRKARVIVYRQGPLLYPEFWQPLLARLQIAAAQNPARKDPKPCVLLPGRDADLLHLDLKLALERLGLRALSVDPSLRPNHLNKLILEERPLFCLSVNLHGLDADGTNFYLLRELDIPLAVWFVDNPWLILSKLRLDWWKQAHLFVTGRGFIADLHKHGAQNVSHLPLAASEFFRDPKPAALPPQTQIVFAGRASFPDKDKYFGAAHLSKALLEQAEALDDKADFNWWRDKLRPTALWPGHAARPAGLGAETVGRARRIKWLSAAAPLGLRVYGGGEWPDLLPPGTDIQPPVDYYAQLPGIYKAAPFCLNLTSPLLPGALTQRNFDVWRAGGFLLCPPETGLDIFPVELLRFSIINNLTDLEPGMDRLNAEPWRKEKIIKEWQDIIDKSHTYPLRIQKIIQKLGLLDRLRPVE